MHGLLLHATFLSSVSWTGPQQTPEEVVHQLGLAITRALLLRFLLLYVPAALCHCASAHTTVANTTGGVMKELNRHKQVSSQLLFQLLYATCLTLKANICYMTAGLLGQL